MDQVLGAGHIVFQFSMGLLGQQVQILIRVVAGIL